MRRRDLLGGLSLVPLAAPAVAQCVLSGFPRINLADRCEGGDANPPSLDLTFMVPGQLDPRITFTRASTGTYFDSAGVMQAAAINAPRCDYDPATRVLRGLLIEEARTNSVTQSGDFTNIAWVKGASATLAAGVPGTNGPTTGSGLISANATIGFLAQAYTAAAGTAITMSCFVKAGSLSSALLLMPATWWADATNRIGTYDLAAGIVSSVTGAGATGTIQPAGNGWYRISMTATPGVAGTTSPQFARAAANGNGVAIQHYAFGAQLEAGAFATSYVPTAGAAVTRAVDLCSMPTGPWFNAAAGSLAVEAYAPPVGANAVLNCAWAALDDGTANNMMELRSQTAFADFRLLSFVGNVNSGASVSGNTMVANAIFKGAGTYTITPASSRISMNGAAPPASTVTALPSATMTTLRIGPSRGNAPNNAVRRVAYHARVLTDAEMQSITRQG